MLPTRTLTALLAGSPAHASSPIACRGFAPSSWWRAIKPQEVQHTSPDPDDTENTGPCEESKAHYLKYTLNHGIGFQFYVLLTQLTLRTRTEQVKAKTFPYARGRSRESNSSGVRESSVGSFFNRTRYYKEKINVFFFECLWSKTLKVECPQPYDTYHVDMQGFATVNLLHQQQEPAPHLLRFIKLAMDGVNWAALTQELQDFKESKILVDQMLVS